ncbi:microtubule-binding calmodulin-regulated spectrin-associated protein [Toxoplasma gondii MAS]|uniref:Microtubule-binding calmodulin-regulated spectrin-associated protein n=1 Tax=Toxoplasma gondii MAS TaxID=943118 RepID=A0A086QQL7_TOXGO|nr:microtubule-binding calmodulin-regulated spectrin-associated protein [Toxoplasma gondii MAS]
MSRIIDWPPNIAFLLFFKDGRVANFFRFFSGEVNRSRRERLIACFKDQWAQCRVFIILLKGPGQRHELRALYALDAERGFVKVAQVYPAPQVLEEAMIENVFRYDCATKRFRRIEGAKSLSPLTAAVTVQRALPPVAAPRKVLYI